MRSSPIIIFDSFLILIFFVLGVAPTAFRRREAQNFQPKLCAAETCGLPLTCETQNVRSEQGCFDYGRHFGMVAHTDRIGHFQCVRSIPSFNRFASSRLM
jgi:hypothetical protein